MFANNEKKKEEKKRRRVSRQERQLDDMYSTDIRATEIIFDK